jgi:hypothetical protein
MNLDVASVFPFGDGASLRQFMLDHATVHNAEAVALHARTGGVFSTFGLLDEMAEDDWIALMERGEPTPTPAPLQAWLEQHSLMHDQTYATLAGTGTVAPDLSIVDFSNPAAFYTWMFVHQQMHDYEQQTLGLS